MAKLSRGIQVWFGPVRGVLKFGFDGGGGYSSLVWTGGGILKFGLDRGVGVVRNFGLDQGRG